MGGSARSPDARRTRCGHHGYLIVDPVVLFFLLGVAARLLKSDLRLPEAMYEGLSIYLLITIGLKGGVELAKQPLVPLLPQVTGVILMGLALPLLAFPVLRYARPPESPRCRLDRRALRLGQHGHVRGGARLPRGSSDSA